MVVFVCINVLFTMSEQFCMPEDMSVTLYLNSVVALLSQAPSLGERNIIVGLSRSWQVHDPEMHVPTRMPQSRSHSVLSQ